MIDPSPSNQGTAAVGTVRIRRADRRSQRSTLAMMLTGQADERDPAVGQFLRFASDAELSLEELWLAERNNRPLAAALVVPNAGRTAMLFLSPLRHRADLPVSQDLAHQAVSRQDGRKIRLIQALLEPSQQMEREALAGAGFVDLAQLLYMGCDTNGSGAHLRLDGAIQVVHWSRRERDLFALATTDSYRDTLDCPGLLGLRQIDDILTGHMATGQFVPQLWFALRYEDEPVGVMLLNLVPQRPAIELVYLGLTPQWRGRGLGRHLVRHGLWLAPRYQASEMILAVDQANTPALALYRSIGFVQTARKLAMIFTLP